MKIDPGYYKVKVKKGFFGTTYHYMRVYVKDRKKFIQMDHNIPEEAEKCEEDIIHQYIIVKKITRPIEVRRIQVKVNWTDEDGDHFELTAANNYVLNKIFELFPRLRKAFDVS